MDAKQFAWLYLIENGYAGVKKAYYGGNDIVDKQAKVVAKTKTRHDEDCIDKIREVYLANIRARGVNWFETEAPESDYVSQFNGTFCDSTKTEVLVGTLMLYGGEQQTWTADAVKVTNVFEMMAKIDSAKEKFESIFGN